MSGYTYIIKPNKSLNFKAATICATASKTASSTTGTFTPVKG